MSILARNEEPSVLVLKGVSLTELCSIDKLWGVGDPATDVELEKKKHKFCKLPRVFSGLDTWPMKSNLDCCKCRMKYNTIPVSMPTQIIRGEDGSLGFRVEYNYCSFPCCIRAILSITDTSMREFRLEMLKLMFKYFFDIDLRTKTIDSSPDPDDLEDCGGDMSKEDFRKKINRITMKLVAGCKLDSQAYLLDIS